MCGCANTRPLNNNSWSNPDPKNGILYFREIPYFFWSCETGLQFTAVTCYTSSVCLPYTCPTYLYKGVNFVFSSRVVEPTRCLSTRECMCRHFASGLITIRQVCAITCNFLLPRKIFLDAWIYTPYFFLEVFRSEVMNFSSFLMQHG